MLFGGDRLRPRLDVQRRTAVCGRTTATTWTPAGAVDRPHADAAGTRAWPTTRWPIASSRSSGYDGSNISPPSTRPGTGTRAAGTRPSGTSPARATTSARLRPRAQPHRPVQRQPAHGRVRRCLGVERRDLDADCRAPARSAQRPARLQPRRGARDVFGATRRARPARICGSGTARRGRSDVVGTFAPRTATARVRCRAAARSSCSRGRDATLRT